MTGLLGSHFSAQKVLPDHGADGRSDNRSGREIREPMDGHGNAHADIERVSDSQIPKPPLFRQEPKHRKGHGECCGAGS